MPPNPTRPPLFSSQLLIIVGEKTIRAALTAITPKRDERARRAADGIRRAAEIAESEGGAGPAPGPGTRPPRRLSPPCRPPVTAPPRRRPEVLSVLVAKAGHRSWAFRSRPVGDGRELAGALQAVDAEARQQVVRAPVRTARPSRPGPARRPPAPHGSSAVIGGRQPGRAPRPSHGRGPRTTR